MIAPVVLASASASRRAMLEAAGIGFAVDPAAVDEAEIKKRLKERRAEAREVAETLARLKAEEVSRRHRDALVVGSDQMLVCEGRWFDKPESRAGARDQLLALKGRRHELIAAVTVVRNG